MSASTSTRRTSARLSGGSDGGGGGGALGGMAASLNGIGAGAGLRQKRTGGEVPPGEDGEGEKKRRKQAKKQPAFHPRPIPLPNSSDTPPDEEIPLPPPPSERKIARRRDSTKAIRERSPDSPPPTKRLKPSAKSSSSRPIAAPNPPATMRDDLLAELAADAPNSSLPSTSALPHVDFLTFSVSQRQKPSAPRPSSPPRPSASASAPSGRTSMGPPTAFVRKTRKSMRGTGFEDVNNEALLPVPESETPMIRKNRDMREAQRRSSLGMRGQRASSSLGRGDISIPHHTVDSSLFYQHISSQLPEPHRARHLLVYCAKRAAEAESAPIPSRSKSKKKAADDGRTEDGDRLVNEIMDEFMANLGKGLVETNVFSDKGPAPSGMSLRPHPRNISNREVQAKVEAYNKRSREECAIWTSLSSRANRKQADLVERLRAKTAMNANPDMTSAPPWLKGALELAEGVIVEGEGDLTSSGEFADVEYKVDTLHASSHAALQYSLQASRFLDGIFSSLASDLSAREQLGLPPSALPSNTDADGVDPIALLSTARTSTATATSSAGPSRPRTDPIVMLRALAVADAQAASDDTVAAAARLAPAGGGARQAAPQSTASMGSMSMTPRRVGITPRRAGVLSGGAGSAMPR